MSEIKLQSERFSGGLYILAVSGGVDSCVLLDLFASQTIANLLVAHVDHGIRPDSSDDARFVEALADFYKLPFKLYSVHLSADASEDEARKARYTFLEQLALQHQADGIVTAHHQDDLIETIALNITRGSNRHGLTPFRNRHDVIRPLIHFTKQDIYAYALKHRLEWVEDETNLSERYKRNRVRRWLNLHADTKQRLHEIYTQMLPINHEIDEQLQDIHEKLSTSEHAIDRRLFKKLDPLVRTHYSALLLLLWGVTNIHSDKVQRFADFGSTANKGKKLSLNTDTFAVICEDTIELERT